MREIPERKRKCMLKPVVTVESDYQRGAAILRSDLGKQRIL
jgi:hypothetical protein